MDRHLARVVKLARKAPSFAEAKAILSLAADDVREGTRFLQDAGYKQTILFVFPHHRVYLDKHHDNSHSIKRFLR